MLTWTAVLNSTGLSAFFASRAFLSAFTFAMLARFGDNIPFLQDNWMIQSMTSAPDWFVHDVTLLVLGVLGTLELLSDKIPEVREFMGNFDSYFKAIMGTVTSMGILSAEDMRVIKPILESGLGTWILAMGVGVVVFGLASIRGQFLSLLRESDSDDSLGIQKLISWAEDVYAFFGPLIFILFPVVMTVILLSIFALIGWWSKKRQLREEKLKRECPSCQELIFRHAAKCHKCNTTIENPHSVSVFGFSKNKLNPIPETQSLRLVTAGRCPICAAPLDGGASTVQCGDCSEIVWDDKELKEAFLSNQRSKLPIALIVCALFSFIPVIGLIPGVIYYRLVLVAPFRRYIPTGKSMALRWGIRLLLFLLIAIQIVPAIGTITVPAMAWISFEAYRAAFVNRFKKVDSSISDSDQSPLPAST